MSFNVRDGYFDCVILAGPRISLWPSVGVRALSTICSEMGLRVGVFGGKTVSVKGVVPLPQTSGLVLIEDAQGRIHRIHSRAIVKVVRPARFPSPFDGWRSDGLIPYDTAKKLLDSNRTNWGQTVALLGSSNRSLRFGSELLERELVRQVVCVEPLAQWGGKRFAAWEVEKRRFEILGGRMLEATPVSLKERSAQAWEFRLKDENGVRIVNVNRIVSVGPYFNETGIREYPPASHLYEFEQTAFETKEISVEDWVLEEERGRYLASRISKALNTELGDKKEFLSKINRRARSRLKKYDDHRVHAFTPSFRGKWLEEEDLELFRKFEGSPQKAHKKRIIASLECIENIPCDLCQKSCPVDAIQIKRGKNVEKSFLIEDQCIGCGACILACPSRAVVMLKENEKQPQSEIVFPWFHGKPPRKGEMVTLLNRQGESLESGRVMDYYQKKDPFENTRKIKEKPRELKPEEVKMILIRVPSHLLWEARGLRRNKESGVLDDDYQAYIDQIIDDGQVEVSLDGEKRLVCEGVTITRALFETGYSRPGDILTCEDGTCGLCTVVVDGVRKNACQETIHKGMAIRLDPLELQKPTHEKTLCACLGQHADEILDQIKKGGIESIESIVSRTRIGEGRCHGQICIEALRSFLLNEGIEDVTLWIDWRFPWSDWSIYPHPKGAYAGRAT